MTANPLMVLIRYSNGLVIISVPSSGSCRMLMNRNEWNALPPSGAAGDVLAEILEGERNQ